MGLPLKPLERLSLERPSLDSARQHAIPGLVAQDYHVSTVLRCGRGPFQCGAQKNSSALAAASNRLPPIVVFEYSPPR